MTVYVMLCTNMLKKKILIGKERKEEFLKLINEIKKNSHQKKKSL
jgi:hypothetical protein